MLHKQWNCGKLSGVYTQYHSTADTAKKKDSE